MLRFWAVIFCWIASALAGHAAGVRDLVVFDEDDPLGIDYYDAGIGRKSGGSELALKGNSKDKLPISQRRAARGKTSGVLRWTSRPGGDWAMHIFAPGFPMLDLRPFARLTFRYNSPAPIAKERLPLVELENDEGGMMRRGFSADADSDPDSWQEVSIDLPRDVDWSRVRHVTFRQNMADGIEHELWIDDLRFVGANRQVAKTPPAPPFDLRARAGDRSVTLHWRAAASEIVGGFQVYRAREANGPFERLTPVPLSLRSFADAQAENGHTNFYYVTALNEAGEGSPSEITGVAGAEFATTDAFLDYVQAAAFDYFWFEANAENGMIRDRSEPWSAASIAAIGFGLTGIGVGIDHGWISRAEGLDRTIRTLRTLAENPQGSGREGVAGYRGWFYHFLDLNRGLRYASSELSSVDTALLFEGILYAAEYFDQPGEEEIGRLAHRILGRVDWKWMLNGGETLSMGWNPETGFLKARWKGYNEASILYLIGLGAERDPLPETCWDSWTRTYRWDQSFGYSFVHFPPLFGHQYSACWVDFRGIADPYMKHRGLTYFENSRRATLAQRAYSIANPQGHPGYGDNVWGLTACDGPGVEGTFGYRARGTPPPENDDGTIAPTAAGGSIAFTPEESILALRHMYDHFREKIWCGYGFRDAFNVGHDWWGSDVIGIDQGPILLMIENYRTGAIWERMTDNETLQRGLRRAGFEKFESR